MRTVKDIVISISEPLVNNVGWLKAVIKWNFYVILFQ